MTTQTDTGSRAESIDAVTLEIVTNALIAASREMGVSLQRAAYSTIIREARDFSCAIFDARGRLVSQAAYIAMHLGGMDVALNAIRQRFGNDLRPGDAYLLNDPYSGAQHMPDIQIFTPVFLKGELIAFVGNVAHHLDMGGRVPGSVAGDNTEIFHDGLRLPPCRVMRDGQMDPLFETILAANIRQPESTMGDLRAQFAANQLGVERVLECFDRFGDDVVLTCIDESIEATEHTLRKRIARMPHRILRGEDWIDDDGVGNGPLRVAVTIEAVGDELVVDFSGTAGQTAGPINSIMSATRASVCYVVRAVLAPDLLPNHGAQVPIRIVAERGSLVDPQFPAACGARTVTCHRIVDAMLAAFADVMPERVAAGSNGNMTMSVGGTTDRGRFIFFEVMPGGLGARSEHDGVAGTDSHLSNCMNAPIEALELEHPILFEHFEFRQDSAGAGRRQGGLGLTREFKLLEGTAVLMMRGDQVERGPIGLRGGRPGTPCRWTLDPGGPNERVLPSKITTAIRAGDRVGRETAGGGGFGDPRERPRGLIERDLREERVTERWVRDNYGADTA